MDDYCFMERVEAENFTESIQEKLSREYPNVDPTIGGIQEALPRYEQAARALREACAKCFTYLFGRQPQEEELFTIHSPWYYEQFFEQNAPIVDFRLQPAQESQPYPLPSFDELLAKNTKEYYEKQEREREEEEHEHD